MSNAATPLIKVFFDGECPMCRREIQHYQGMRGAEDIEWIDITDRSTNLEQYGLAMDVAMARFHVLDKQGRWQTGVYGFSEMWRQLPSLRWLSMLLQTLRLLPIADWAYTHFARWRLKRRCSEGVCKT